MGNKVLMEIYKIVSKKYDVVGEVRDYGVVIKLVFVYEGKEIVIGLSRPYMKSLEEMGLDVMESYLECLHENTERKLQLHYWYITSEDFGKGKEVLIANGRVSGHSRLDDSVHIHTSMIRDIMVDYSAEELVIRTKNSIYHCPFAFCNFNVQGEAPELVPDYEEIVKYKGTYKEPTIEPGNVLMVLSNFDDYYFHSLVYIPEGSAEAVKYRTWPHIGMFQDSYLIVSETGEIDIRYFPHYRNIELYLAPGSGVPFFAENIGDAVLYVVCDKNTYKLNPGERKELKEENAEKEIPILADGDLYPAEIIDGYGDIDIEALLKG